MAIQLGQTSLNVSVRVEGGYGEGFLFLGNATVDASGGFAADLAIPESVPLDEGSLIAGMTIHPSHGSSEFGPDAVVADPRGGYRLAERAPMQLSSDPGWWNPGWHYRVPIELSPGEEQTLIWLNLSSSFENLSIVGTPENGSARLVDPTGSPIPCESEIFWRNQSLLVRVNASDLPGAGTYYLYWDIEENGDKDQYWGWPNWGLERGDASSWILGADNAPNGQLEASPPGPYTVDDAYGTPGTITDPGYPYAGEFSLLMGYRDFPEDGGTNELWAYRDFAVPGSGGYLVLHYNMHSWDSADYDYLSIELRDTSNNTLATVVDHYNPNPGTDYGTYASSGWLEVTVDLSPYAGTTIRLFILLHCFSDDSYKSWVYVDSVLVTGSVFVADAGRSEGFAVDGWLEDDELQQGDYVGVYVRSEAFPTCSAVAEIYAPGMVYVATATLYDDGTHGDAVAGDGVYTNLQAYQVRPSDPPGVWTIVAKSLDCSSSTIGPSMDGLIHRRGRPAEPVNGDNYYNACSLSFRVLGPSISGLVFEDKGNLGKHYDPSEDVPKGGVRYRIYRDDGDHVLDDGDILVDEGRTAGDGTFLYAPSEEGIYFVVVNSRDVYPSDPLNPGYTYYDSWAEQTFGVTWNESSSNFESGPVYGGLDPDASDFFNTTPIPSQNRYEHLSVVYYDGSPIPPIEFGFSFDLISSSSDYFEGERYRIPITVYNPGASDLRDFQIRLELGPSFPYDHLEPDGSDLRFYLEGGGELGYWIQSWSPGGTSVVWVRVPEIPAGGTVTIYAYYGDRRLGPASDMGIMDPMELGLITTTNTIASGDVGNDPSTWTWDHVPLTGPFSDPVIVAQFPSRAGGQSSVVRIKDPGPEGFDVRIVEPSNRDNRHVSESFGYLALDRGLYWTVNGIVIWAEKYSTTSTVGKQVSNAWDTFDLSWIGFPTDPIVFAQPMTSNDVSQQHRFVKCRLRDLRDSDGAFRVALEEEYDNADQRPVAEVVALIAVQRNSTSGSWAMHYPTMGGDTVLLEWGVSYDNVRGIANGWRTVNFPISFPNPPILVLSYGSYDGPDNSELRRRSLTSSYFTVAVEEDYTHGSDSEGNTRHTTEDVFWIAVSQGAVLPIAKYAVPYPTVSLGAEEEVWPAAQGTIRRFIQNSNVLSGGQRSVSRIRSPHDGWWTVRPMREMDAILDDGTELVLHNDVDPTPGTWTLENPLGATGSIYVPEVEIDCGGNPWAGLRILGGDARIDGISISNTSGTGILVSGDGARMQNISVGYRPDGTYLPVLGYALDSQGPSTLLEGARLGSEDVAVRLSGNSYTVSWTMVTRGTTGILLVGDGGLVSNTLVENCTSDGVRAEGSGIGLFLVTVRENGGNGISILGDSVTVSVVSIYNNTGLGIDLGADGVDENDGALDPSRPNHGVDYPVITVAKWYRSTRTLHVEGYVGLGSGSPEFSGCTVEIYLVRTGEYGDNLVGNS